MADDDSHLIPPAEPERPEDLGDPRDVRRRRVSARQAELDSQAYTTSIMSSKIGRRWMWEKLSWCGIGHNPFSTNALIMAHDCGQLNIGNRLIAEISIACPELYITMMQENADARPQPSDVDAARGGSVQSAAESATGGTPEAS